MSEVKYVSTLEPFDSHDSVLDKVSDILDIELSRGARKELSFITQRNTYYHKSILPKDSEVTFPSPEGLMVIGLDGYGSEIYYIKHATGSFDKIDVFKEFIPYQPKHIVVVTNIKGMGITNIYSITRA